MVGSERGVLVAVWRMQGCLLELLRLVMGSYSLLWVLLSDFSMAFEGKGDWVSVQDALRMNLRD